MEWIIMASDPAPAGSSAGETIRLSGDFDLYEGPRFATEIMGHIRAGHHDLVLDMGAVDYLDSCGVGIIIKLLQQTRLAGGRLRVCGLHGSPRRVLEMSNVISLLEEVTAGPA
jgi:anti-sigma B factor antagonist